jgi:tetratricopeptide (TPR) repeat protein
LQVAATRGFRGGAGIEGQLLGGYRFSAAQEGDRDSAGHWSAGASLGWQVWALDYAFVPMGQQEASHHFGLRYRFGGPSSPVKEELRPAAVAPTLNDPLAKARALEASGQAVPALNAYAAAIAINPSDLPAWKGMAKLYDRLQRPDFALRCWRAVAHLDPADPEAQEALKK